MDVLSAFISSKLAVGEHVYMKMRNGVDTLQDTHCLCLNRCIYGLCQSLCALFMLAREVYINAGFTQLKSDKCVFVQIQHNIIGGPASLSPEDVINHGAFVSMSNVPPAQRIYPSCPHGVAALFIIVYLTIMLYAIIATNSLNSLRLQLLRMLVFNCIVMGILNGLYLFDMLLI